MLIGPRLFEPKEWETEQELSYFRDLRPAHRGQASVREATSSHPLPPGPKNRSTSVYETLCRRYTLSLAFSWNRNTSVRLGSLGLGRKADLREELVLKAG